MDKNKISRNQLIILYEKQKGKCAYCDCSLLEETKTQRGIQVDHINPLSKNGENSMGNKCLTCAWCNRVKHNKTMEEFLTYIKPYLDGIVSKKDLRDYNQYQKLKEKFGRE